MIRGNAGRHICLVCNSALCPSPACYAECSPHSTLCWGFLRNGWCAKVRTVEERTTGARSLLAVIVAPDGCFVKRRCRPPGGGRSASHRSQAAPRGRRAAAPWVLPPRLLQRLPRQCAFCQPKTGPFDSRKEGQSLSQRLLNCRKPRGPPSGVFHISTARLSHGFV